MKKSIIAMAVAGALAVPAIASADATIYGQLRLAMVDEKGDSLDLRDQTSRIGIRGTVDLGLEDTRGIYRVEERVNVNTGTLAGGGRLGFIGATGSWGTVMGGRFDHPSYSMVTGYTDNTYSGRVTDSLYGDVSERVSSSVAYASPDFNGVQFIIGGLFAGDSFSAPERDEFGQIIVTDQAGTPRIERIKDKAIDGYNLGVKYDANDIYAALAYGNVKAGKNDDAARTTRNSLDFWGLALGYTGVENLELAAKYERARVKALAGDFVTSDPTLKETVYGLAATYHIDATHLYANYGRNKVSFDGESFKGTTHTVGVGHTLGRGLVFAQYDNAKKELNEDLNRRFSLGYRLNF